jgi:hypothetical protein
LLHVVVLPTWGDVKLRRNDLERVLPPESCRYVQRAGGSSREGHSRSVRVGRIVEV